MVEYGSGVVPEPVPEAPIEQKTDTQVASWFRDGFEEIYEKGFPFPDADSMHPIEIGRFIREKIAERVGESDTYKQRRLTERYSKGVEIFLKTLIGFIEEKSESAKDLEEKKQLAEFIERIHDALFSYSPNVTEGLRTPEMLVVSSMANRVPEVQGWFGQTMVGEMAYELAFYRGSMEGVINHIKDKPVGELLDIIHQLETVGANAIGNGEWAEPTLDRVSEILKGLSDHPSPLVHYAITSTIDRLQEEEQNPTMGVVTWHGNKSAGRLAEKMNRQMDIEHVEISRTVNPDVPVNGMLVMVARDAIGMIDQSAIPRMLARVDTKALPEALPVSIVALRNVLGALDGRRLRTGEWERIVEFTNQRIIVPYLSIQNRDASTIGDITNPESMKAVLEEIQSELEKKLVPAHFESYKKIHSNQLLNPFGVEENDLVLLLQQLHRPTLRAQIEDDLQIQLKEISIRSQIHFLRFLAGQDTTGFNRLRNVLGRNPDAVNEILETFLANSEDTRYAEAILKLGEQFDADVVRGVVTKYAEIVEASERMREYITSAFKNRENVSEEAVTDAIRHLLHKANELLARFASQPGHDTEKILAQLENAKSEIFLFASAFKAASTEGHLEFSDVRDAALMEKDSSELTEEERAAMLRIFEENRPQYSPELLKETMTEFQGAIGVAGSEVYLLKNKKELVAFMRFDQLENGNLYAGSLNVRPEARGSTIGSAMLKVTLDEKSKSHDIEAVAYEKNPMLKHYTREFGFEITGEIPNYHNTGALFFKLKRPRSEPHVLEQ